MAGGICRQRKRRHGGDLPASLRGAGHGRCLRTREQDHRRARGAGQRQPPRRGEIEQRLASMQFEQHCRRGAVAHAVQPGAQQRLAVLQQEQGHRVGIEAQLDEAGAIGPTHSIVLPRPDQRSSVELAAQPRDEQGEAERGRAVARIGGVKFVEPVGAQPAGKRLVQPGLAERHHAHGQRCHRLHGRQRRIDLHVFMICSFWKRVSRSPRGWLFRQRKIRTPRPTRLP